MPRPDPKPVYDCSVHDFYTEDPNEFRNHLSTIDHTVSGNTICSECRKNKCDNDPKEATQAHPGQALAKCDECIAKEEQRVIDRLRKEGRTHEVLDVKKE